MELSPKKCPHCDTWNPSEARFCRNCGHNIYGTPEPKPKSKPNVNENSTEVIGRVFLAIIGIIAIIVSFVLFFNGEISKPIAVCIALGGVSCLGGLKS